MLFFNFLCLFYLMVLINGHTISKNREYREEFDKTHDSLNNFDYKWEFTPKRVGLRQIHRREGKEAPLVPQKTTRATKTTKTTKTKKVSVVVSTVASANSSSPCISFWKKLRHKWTGDKDGNKKESLYLRKRKVPKRGKRYRQYGIDTRFMSNEDVFDDTRVPNPDVDRRRNRYRAHTNKRKRAVSLTTLTPSLLTVTFPTDGRSSTSPSRKATTRLLASKMSNIASSKVFSLLKDYSSTKSLSESLQEITSRISTLKQAYGLTLNDSPNVQSTETPLKETVTISVTTTPSTTSEIDFPGTAQIEALLNDIKIKAVEMAAAQNPAVADMITNTVTETTFEADPIITHNGWNTRNFALSTFISIDIPPSNKRTVDSNETVVIANTEPTHNIGARSIQEDMCTAAHSIENMLQSQLKKVYRKVKCKMSSQLRSEIDQVTSSTKCHSRKVVTKVNKAICKSKCKTHTATTPALRRPALKTPVSKTPALKTPASPTRVMNTGNPVRRSNDYKQARNQLTATTASSYMPTLPTTFDDYMMLTLFEHILARTHQDNVMKLLATTEASGPLIKRNHKQKREDNVATSVAVDGNARFQDYTEVADYFYSSLPTSAHESSVLTTTSDASTASTEDSSYEGLSNKISYNDYVNGYKHYLKFQKQQGEQKFSNLVRYQAHRHHKVDDIGKFILNKIPQLQTVREKRFFVDYNVEDEASTKSDESWFKKHFYFFNDNIPKKFHTSQTVELKSPISSFESTPGTGSTKPNAVESSTCTSSSPYISSSTFTTQKPTEISEPTEINLDSLSKDFYQHKTWESLPTYDTIEADFLTDITEADKEQKQTPDPVEFKVHNHMNFIKRIFGRKSSNTKRGSTPAEYKDNLNEKNQIEPYEYSENDDPQRDKRNLKEHAKDNVKYPITAKVTTERSVTDRKNKNYGYVDVNLIPRPTAIVKLRENKSKKGRMRKFFNKFRFHKRKQEKKKTKRENRMPRFNPLKKFRDMLMRGKGHPYTFPEKDSGRDEAILTTRIDTFKSIKYDQMPSVEEMSREVPNITGEIEQPNSAYEFQYPLKYTAEEKMVTETSTRYSKAKAPTTLKSTTGHKAQKLTKKPINFDNLEKKLKATTANDNFATISYHIPINYESFKKLNKDKPNEIYKTPTVNVKYTNNRIPSKSRLTTGTYESTPILFDDAEVDYTTPTPMTMMDYTPIPNNLAVVPHRIYIPPHLQSSEEQDMDDIKIHSKVSRLVKFSFPRSEKCFSSRNVGGFGSQNTGTEFTTLSDKYFKREIKETPLVTSSTLDFNLDKDSYKSKDPSKSSNTRPRYTHIPDYFNDLLMWHGDLLNTDKLTTPTWQKVMASIGVAEPTTPNVDLRNEVENLNEFLLAFGIKGKENDKKYSIAKKARSKVRSNKAKKDKVRSNDYILKPRNVIKTVAVQDDAVAKAGDVVVKARANYLKVAKRPSSELQSIASIFMSEGEKMYFKPYAKARHVKFDEKFWKGKSDHGTEQPEDSSEIFLDTTLLAYDDGPDSLIQRPVNKLVSKNSLGSSFDLRNKKLPMKAITKTYPSPSQYFSTPLPMRINEFEEFLKENKIDVQSVTTPLNMPQLIYSKKSLSAKPTQSPFRAMSKKKMKAMKTFTVPSYTTEAEYPSYTKEKKTIQLTAPRNDDDQLFEPSLYLTDNGKIYTESVRDKRFKKNDDDEYISETRTTTAMKKKKKLKKKRKFTDVLENVYMSPTSDSTDIELTIINLDDLNLKSTPKPTLRDSWGFLHKSMPVSINSNSGTNKKTRNTTKRKVKVSTESVIISSMSDEHEESNVDGTKTSTEVPPDRNQPTKDQNPGDKMEPDSTNIFPSTDNVPFNENYPFLVHRKSHHPKRIKIYSHNYKYDIIYNLNKRSKRSTTTTPFTPTYLEVDINKNTKDSEVSAISFIHSTRKLGRDIKIIRIVKAVEAVENFTRPNVIIHIDLPTYYAPYTGPTEPIFTRKPKGIWTDAILKYLSGIALVELLHKFGIIKTDGSLNFTDGVDNAVNATEVFSRPENDVGQDIKYDTTQQESHQESPQLENKKPSHFQESISLQPNWREKRRLKILSHIKGKLKHLLHKTSKQSTTSVTTEYSSESTSLTPPLAEKIKREKVDEWKNDIIAKNSLPVVYNLDVDKIVEKATSFDDIITIKMDHIKNYAELPTPTTSTPDSVQIQSIPTTLLVTGLDGDGLYSRDEVHYEGQPQILHMYNKPLLKTTIDSILQDAAKETSGTKLGKRDTSQKFTAKDVAAIEVIIDMVKNTGNFDGLDSVHQTFNNFLVQPTTPLYNPGTNNIQVHVAIPYTFDKKRDAEKIKVRKVFAAKMDRPVDLEYQVHAWENPVVENPSKANALASDLVNSMVNNANNIPSNVNSNVNGNKSPPKLYLLVDNSGTLAQGNYALKPVAGDVDLSKVKVRQAESTKTFEQVDKNDKTTAVTPNTTNKVTLSKDFVAAINKHLVQLYANLTSLNRTAVRHNIKIRKAGQFEPDTFNNDKMEYRRHINWDMLQRFFGHERVCNCKCKPNRTMCRACAASDAVIHELIFEFDNLAKYMSDHCTEIQTFFWMNPSGGKKLRDSVHRVDQSLHDYYKRVKGKCQGKKCNTFSTCIDKRSIAEEKTIPRKYIGNILISDIQRIAEDIDAVSKYRTCFNKQLIAEGQRLVDIMNNCVRPPSIRNKLEIPNSKPLVKNVYSVDKINVNIICQPTDTDLEFTDTTAVTVNPNKYFYADTIGTEYNSYLQPEKKLKAYKNLSRLFARRQPTKQEKMKHFFTYYVMSNGAVSKPMNIFQKRHISTEIPFIADKDSIQIEDFTKSNHGQKRVIRESLNKDVETSSGVLSSESILNDFPQFASTVDHMLVNSNSDKDPSIETLSYNINELFKIFHNLTDLNEVRDLSTNLNSYDKIEKTTTKPKKTKKTTKKIKTHKSTLHKTQQTFHKTTTKHKSSSKQKTVNAIKETEITEQTSSKTTRSPKTTSKTKPKPIQVPCKTKCKPKVCKKPQKDSKAKTETTQKDFNITTSVTTEAPLDNQLKSLDLLDPKVAKPINGTKGSEGPKNKVFPTTTPINMNSVPTTAFSSLSTTPISTTTEAIDATSIINANEVASSTETTYNYTTKSLFQRLKSVSIDFFYNRIKTTSTTKENLQFLRSSMTESMSKQETNEDIEMTSPSSGPTIIILSDISDDWSVSLEENYTPPSLVEDKPKNLLLSILDYEAKKLNYEWKRYKKDNRVDRQSFNTSPFIIFAKTNATTKATKEPHFEIKDKPSSKDVYYDVMVHAPKVGELPVPPGFEVPEKKNASFIQKFVNRFQFKHTCNCKLTPPTRKRQQRRRSRSRSRGRRPSPPRPRTESSPRSAWTTRRTRNRKNTEGFQDTKPQHKLLCDVEATFQHVKKLQTNMSKEEFEEYVKHVKCYKYYKPPSYFLIQFRNGRRDVGERQTDRFKEEGKRRMRSDRKFKWDWIRNRRSVDFNDTGITDDDTDNLTNKPYTHDDYNLDNVNLTNNGSKEDYIGDAEESFETFYKDRNGIYRRKKRSIDDVKVLEALIKNTPLQPKPHETYVMSGDSAVIHCSSASSTVNTSHNETAKWKTSRKEMLFYKNVAVRGERLIISKAEAKNQGVYVCKKGDALERNVKLTVITLPTYEVVSTLLHSLDNACTYNDLKTAHHIGRAITQECCPTSECCSVRIEEPVCLRDQSGSAHLRLSAVISAPPRRVSCGARCRRDAHASLALLTAENVPAVASVPVLIANRGINKTLVPLIPKHKKRFIVTHTLRRKDYIHRKYRGTTPPPGGVRVISSCPAGYYLEGHQKICVACPSGTYARYGDNFCTRCSRGFNSQPGEGRCHFIRRRARRYTWWWYGSAGAGACALWLAAFVCSAIAAVRVRKRIQRKQCKEDVVVLPVTSIKRKTPTPRPLSPSRVILTKFFRGSRSSTKATDSQETKFGLWKEKNMPPPLPPIDFDI